MNGRELNLLNIGLMLISCIVAYIIPFELFLFSYAILGPLHYLTEISWLHQRNYFVKGKYDFLWLLLLAVFATLANLGFRQFHKISMFAPYLALFSALAFYLMKDWYLKGIAILLIFISASFFNNSTFYLVFFLIFLPTIIHVFIFTGTFIFYGAIKSKSSTGIISLLVFVLCALSFFFFVPASLTYQVGDYVKNTYKDFSVVNHYLINITNLKDLKSFNTQSLQTIFTTQVGFKVMRFIAFAYTYHYLNWFSKTSIIKWHLIDRRYLIATLALWIISIVVYAYDYHSGLKFLFFLSFLHVFLEFPLNMKTFIEIGKEIKGFSVVKVIEKK